MNEAKHQRNLRSKEGILSYRMMRTLTNEIRRLQKANQYLCRKLKEATGKSMDITLTTQESGLSSSTEKPENEKK